MMVTLNMYVRILRVHLWKHEYQYLVQEIKYNV